MNQENDMADRHDVRLTAVDIPFKDVLATSFKFLAATLLVYLIVFVVIFIPLTVLF